MCKKVNVEKKVFEFYRRIVFGSLYERRKVIEPNIVNWCFNSAWKDMASHTLIFKNKNINNKLKIKIKENFKKEFFEKTGSKIFNNWRYYFDNNKIREMISDCCNIRYKVESKTELTYDKYFDFTFGQAQKVVNMFFKYLYTFKDDLIISDRAFNICDCPIDNKTLERIYNYEEVKFKKNQKYVRLATKKGDTYYYKNRNNKKFPNEEFSWSKLDDINIYIEIQNIIAKMIKDKHYNVRKYKTLLDFEFDWQ